MSERELVDRFQQRVLDDPALAGGARHLVPFRRLHTDANIVRVLDSLAAHWRAVRKEAPCPPTSESSASCTTC